uniref:Protein sleepless n=1 Tax=Mesocestoides corti TaxID=53468 RepID=A0A5K3FJ05_MESCO
MKTLFIVLLDVGVLLLVMLPRMTLGLACYSCVSVSGSNRECEDPMHGSVHVEAPCRQGQPGHEGLGYARYCVKIKGRRVADGQQIYIRRCSMQKLGGINTHCGQFRLSDELYRGCIATCTQNWCNAVQPAPKPTFLATLLSLTLLALRP